MLKVMAAVLLAAVVASGCGSPAAPAKPAAQVLPNVSVPASPARSPPTANASLPYYRCDQGTEFTVRFVDDTAVLDSGPRGIDVLLRDAGGATPQQTVYSNSRVRAEFGLGAGGREAILRYVTTPLVAHCMRS